MQPWFYCDACGDSIKKPKVLAHLNQCYTSSFTCIDCSRQFDPSSVAGHTQCVTEHDKYAKGATKPGGFAEKGFYEEGGKKQGSGDGGGGISGEEFLSTRPPWCCSVCNVTCTSRETLENHATGAKHTRRVRARMGGVAATGKKEDDMIESSENKKEEHALKKQADSIEKKKEETKEEKKEMKRKKKKKEKKEEKEPDQPLSKKMWKKKLKKVALKILSKNGPKMRRRPFFAALASVMEERECDEEYAEKILNNSHSIAFLKNKKVELTDWVHHHQKYR